MYTIKMPGGQYLEGEFNLSFELNNQVFSTSDASVLPGSFSFPAEVALTPANRVLLGFPEVVTKATVWQNFSGVWVYCEQQPMFFGTLSIRTANKTKASVNIVANPIKRLKDINLRDLSMGERDLGSFATWEDLMLDSAQHPEDHAFIFFPVHNEARNDYEYDVGDPLNSRRPWWNYFHPPTEVFDDQSAALVPFIKLDFLLESIFAAEDTGFSFSNEWQTDIELRRLCVFNNRDIRTLNGSGDPDLPDSFELARHLPNLKATEFLKKVMAQWGLGLFTNIFDASIRLVPVQTLLKRPPAHDWTQYVISDNTIEAPDDAPVYFNYEQPEEAAGGVPAPETVQVFNTLPDFNAALPLPDGFYYIETEHMTVQIKAAGPYTPFDAWLQHRGVRLADGDRYDAGMESLLHIAQSDAYDSPVVASRYYETTDNTGATVWEWRDTDYPTALMLYRGFNDVGWANPYPTACNHVWNPFSTGGTRLDLTDGATVLGQAERSLNWHGDYGLYETAHKTWANMLLNGKSVAVTLALPVASLTAFSFEDKVRILNMDYFVKKLRVGKPLGGGLVQVEASMVSVI